MEWRDKHGLPRNSPRVSSQDTELGNASAVDPSEVEKRRNALVRRRLMLGQYTKLIDRLRREPAVIAAVGCSLPEKAQGEFANLVANHMFSSQTVLDYSKSFEKVIDAAIRQHSEAQTLLGSMGSTKSMMSKINNRNKSNRYDHFLLCLIQNQAQSRDSISFTKAVINEIDFTALVKSSNVLHEQRNSIASPTNLYDSGGSRSISGKVFANDMSPSLQGALQLIDAMCSTVLEGSVSMPRSIFSVCQSLSDHPGPISATDFLFDTMLCRELEIEAKSKLSNSVGSDANKKMGRLFLDICVHIRTIISKTKWKGKSLKYKATISNAQASLNAFVQRVVQVNPEIFEAQNDHAVYGKVMKERLVLSCFQLYLLHMSVYRFVNMPHSYPQPRMETMDLLSQLGEPIPLPGTEKWGSSENPFTVLVAPNASPRATQAASLSPADSAIVASDGIEVPEFLMTPKRVQRNFTAANLAIKNCKEYLKAKHVNDNSKNILLALETTIDDIELKVKTEKWLKETLEKSTNVSLAIEDVLKSSHNSGIKLVDTLSARSPARSKFISVNSSRSKAKDEQLSIMLKDENNRIAASSPVRNGVNVGGDAYLSSPIQTLMSTVFSPLHLRNEMRGVSGSTRVSPSAKRSFNVF